jgi:hypothetical protein
MKKFFKMKKKASIKNCLLMLESILEIAAKAMRAYLSQRFKIYLAQFWGPLKD